MLKTCATWGAKMTRDEWGALLNRKQQALEAMRAVWPVLVSELEAMRADAVASLVAQESEQVRGRIKALDAVMDLPHTVKDEVQQLAQMFEDHPE